MVDIAGLDEAWRAEPARKPFRMRWRYAAAAIGLFACLPIAALFLIAMQGSAGLWPHMFAHVLPAALRDTMILLAGVGVVVMLLGTTTAWLVTAYDFPGRRVLEWALLLPLAVPTYIIAYAYLDLLHPVGAVQGLIRDLLGYQSPREFRLPDIRAMWACILLLGLVLYPYVYLTTRAMFLTQAANVIEVSRTLGVKPSGVFLHVALPLARPAIAIGLSLALMETLNDIGASEFLGVRTLTVSVYTTWVTRNDLPAAAQIALAMLVIVIALVVLERYSRRSQRYAAAAQKSRVMVPARLRPAAGLAALVYCAMPVFLGFVAPAIYLATEAWKRYQFAGISPRIWGEIVNTVSIAAMATIVVLCCGALLAFAKRTEPGLATRLSARTSTLGYAVPGTVLALGLLLPVGLFDRSLARLTETLFGQSIGLLLLGSGAALILAYTGRFLAITTGGMEVGLARIPRSFDQAARTLGQTQGGVFRTIHLPLSKAALVSAGLLVFVDCMKELPATLLLRPLNFETLATHLYGEAARGTYEEASIAALLIVLIGILPVIVLSRIGATRSAVESKGASAAPFQGT